MSKIIEFKNKPTKRKFISGKILDKKTTAKDIDSKIEEYNGVFEVSIVNKKTIGMRCKGCGCYMEIPNEVFITRKIKCVVCFNTARSAFKRNVKTINELNKINAKYLSGKREYHYGTILGVGKTRNYRRRSISEYRSEVASFLDDDITIINVPTSQDQQVSFKCNKCGKLFQLRLGYVLHSKSKVNCPICRLKPVSIVNKS